MQASKAQPVSPALAALLSKSVELKEMGQRAVTSYLRSVFLQPNKAVFDVTRLPVAEYAQAMGLLAAPKLRFLKKAGKGQGRLLKGLPEARGSSGAAAEDSSLPPGGGDDDDAPSDGAGHAVAAAPRAAASKRKAVGGSEEQPAGGAGASSSGRDDGDDGDELLVVKKRDVFATEAGGAELAIAAAVGAAEERRKKRKLLKIKLGKMAGNRTVFDAEGRAMEPLALLAANGLGAGEGGEEGLGEAAGNEGMTAEERFRAAAALMRVRDRQDKAEIKALRKEMRRAAKARQRAAREAEMGGGDGDYGVVLGRGSDDDKKEEERQEESEEGGRSSSGASGSSSSGDAGASGTDSDSGDSGGAESSEVASMSEGASEEEQAATRRGRQKLQQHSSGVVASGGSKRSADAPIAPSNTGKGAAGASNKRAKTVESLSLAEAEALVLARLTSGKTAS